MTYTFEEVFVIFVNSMSVLAITLDASKYGSHNISYISLG